MKLTREERDFIMEFEKRQREEFDLAQERKKKKPLLVSLTNPRSLAKAILILPIPWVCLYTVLQLSQEEQLQKQKDLKPVGFAMAFFVGYFVADLMTGLIHLYFDTLPLRMSPNKTLMEYIAWGFQRHHALQQNWLHDDIFESGILTSGSLTFPFYVLYLTLYYRWGQVTSPYVAFGWTIFLTAAMHVQLFHAAAHNTFKGSHLLQSILRQLMVMRFILDCKEHHEHHTRFDCNFSLINGWSNCLVNPLYRYLERNGYIDPTMQAQTQQKVYIQQKGQLLEPYYRMFPEYRAYQERMHIEEEQQQQQKDNQQDVKE